jgi:site-specific recombinase XerD
VTPRSLGHVVTYLRSVGAAPFPPDPPPGPLDELLAAYERWLVTERSLAPITVHGYMHTTKGFVEWECEADIDKVLGLTAAEMAEYLRRLCRRYSARSVNEVVVRLRSFFRLLYLKGLIDTPLAQAVPWMASGRASSLPRTLPAGHAEMILTSCNRATRSGKRDFAVLKLLIRLGLRRVEVAALQLSDLDWRNGELMVPGKGGWHDPLPLPVDVGEAVVEYLEVRGRDGGSRNLFMQVIPPIGPLQRSGVGAIVRRACERCGLPDVGTHRLRHAIATEMLRRGAPLYEIGQVLRHRDIETTAIYAKVDLAALATLARPWPGSTR